MKNIKDYFGTKTAIKCENEQQWEKLKELTKEKVNTLMKFDPDFNCFILKGSGGACRETHQLYQILPYSDFVSDVPELVGVEMEVSDDGIDWSKRLVYGRCELGCICKTHIGGGIIIYLYARPIHPKKVITATLQELAEKLGVDEIQLK